VAPIGFPPTQQSAGRIDDAAPAIAVAAFVDIFLRAAFRAKLQRLIGKQLFLGEAVIDFGHVDIGRADA
jgi:hypothetical protein